MINTSNLSEARKQIQKLIKEGKEVVVMAKDDNFNRKILENKDVDMIVGLETDRRDYLKQRDSGLNEVMCKLARDNSIKIGIDVSVLVSLGKLEKARSLARVRQNIGLCKRIGCKMVLLGGLGRKAGTASGDAVGHNKQDVLSFFLSLKGSTKQAKVAFSFK